jgi:hypothetical protein
VKVFPFILYSILFLLSCDKGSSCDNCGDLFNGSTILKVSQNDLMKYEGLAKIDGINIGTCIQGNIYQQDLILSSVKILDDCCCEI